MAEIKNLTGAKVAKMVDAGTAQSVWDKILTIGGFGDVPFDHAGGIDISGLSEGNQEQIQKLLVKEEKPEPETAESLAKNNDRKALDAMAKDLNLDGNKYTDKTELAKAIVQAKSEKEGNK